MLAALGGFLGKNAGAIIGGGMSLLGGERANLASAKQASQQMDFQERMSSTAHQREVADLRAAGLNPILSGTGGMGASSPGGAMAPMRDTLSPAVSTALEARRNKAEVDNMETTNINLKEQYNQIKAQTFQATEAGNASAAQAALHTANLPKQAVLGELYSLPLEAVKEIKTHILRPLIEKLKSPSTAKAYKETVSKIKSLIDKAKEDATIFKLNVKEIPSNFKNKLKNIYNKKINKGVEWSDENTLPN